MGSRRIVLYDGQRWAGNERLVGALSGATGKPREEMESALSAAGATRFDELDSEAASELAAVLDELGVEFDLEDSTLDESRLDWLRAEVPKWVRRGLVHPASVPRIFDNYGAAPPPDPPPAATAPVRKREVGTGTLLRIILGFGAVLIGLGLILFIAANWQKIPPAVRIAGTLLLTLAALHLGYRLRFVQERPKLGATLFLMALFGIGGVVLLTGQIYHVQADSYVLPAIWGGLVLPVGLLLRFKPAIYFASALWFGAFLFYHQDYGEAAWLYVVLLVGFLLPYSVWTRDRHLLVLHVALLFVAMLSTVVMESFWPCTVLMAGFVGLRLWYRRPLYDWLLFAALAIWQLIFLLTFDDLPNVFFALPLAYLGWQAVRSRSSSLMIAVVLNGWLWMTVALLQAIERYEWTQPNALGVTMWFFTSGLLWLGVGKWLEDRSEWRALSTFLRFGGVALAGLMVFILSFRFYDDSDRFYDSWIFLGGTLTFGAIGLALTIPRLLRGQPAEDRRGSLILTALAAAALLLSLTTAPSLVVHPLLFNLILFAGALIFIVRGHRHASLAWFNLGIALFVVLIVSRYLDTLVEYLPRSIFFVLGGLFLIVWAIFVDRQRKRRAAKEEASDA